MLETASEQKNELTPTSANWLFDLWHRYDMLETASEQKNELTPTLPSRNITRSKRPKRRSKHRSGTNYVSEGKTSALVERMFNVTGVELSATGKLGKSAYSQSLIHLGQPNTIRDKRECGIPVRVRIDGTEDIIETRLVPQWRFGKGMRKHVIMRHAMNKTKYHLTEEADGTLSLKFF